MTQPALGLLSSAIVMAIALGFISLFDFGTFAGWIAFVMLGLIPMQVVAVVLWGGNPAFASGLRQPVKGIVLVLVTAIATAIITPLVFMTVGEGAAPPGPIPSHYAVIVVPTTFWLTIMMGGWPFNRVSSNPIVSGLLTLVAAYVVTYVVFRVFFNYDFMQGAPVYLASAPHGLFNGVNALVFIVTALAAMFLILCFDLWPLTVTPSVMQQPALGVTWTIVAALIAWVAMFVGITTMGTDPMVFLVKVTVPFIFGSIIVLNMFQNSLAGSLAQPVKGLVNTVLVVVIGQALAALFSAAAPSLAGPLTAGPPGYDFEVWMANALLSVTFPFLIFLAAYFAYWPLAKRP